MSQYESELLILLVEDLYGDLCSTVFKALIHLHRTTLPVLAQYTGLQTRRLKATLCVLIQNHLVVFNTSRDEGITFYEADRKGAYDIVRFGKSVKICEERFGRGAGQVIAHVLSLGHVPIAEIIQKYNAEMSQKSKRGKKRLRTNPPATNGAGATADHTEITSSTFSAIESQKHLRAIVRQLLDEQMLLPERQYFFKPSYDVHEEAEAIVKKEEFPKGLKGTKDKARLLQQVNELKRKWRDDDDDGDGTGRNGSAAKAIRKFKTPRINGAFTNGVNGNHVNGDEDVELNEELVVRLNHERISVAIRTERLTNLAGRYLGEIPSKVYRVLLRSIEDQIPRCFDDLKDNGNESDEEDEIRPTTSTTNVASLLAELYPKVNLKDGLVHGQLNGHSDGADGHQDSDEESDSDEDTVRPAGSREALRENKERLSDVREHLWALADDPRGFITWTNSPSREWEVDLSRLNQVLIQHELEETVTHSFGNMGTKVLRILKDKGKLDEKQISTFGLLRPKDIRPVLSAMQETGFIDLQEVPKDLSRQTSKSLWFWYFDPVRTRQNMLQATFKGMSRCLQRAKKQRLEFNLVVDKADRLDIRGKEDAQLTRAEREQLAKWKEIEEKLHVQLGRMDDTIAVLRDFDGAVGEN
ncbi:hypothetical protein P152DRAFT_512810 [Eremomyces bilateralis CBS 781.70]|uniref:DNA-directed RNA polymerase III subunit RPC3 n=1 Tax=Eremomyces bilateralis CBS 781.70 TaxID=1392243 RepID=A0A6G1G971_9PEZI|nr:uncharacterized protein P152DRAFT_512810 [Eremomyces bilateralis CBS 781.70]KAF1814450.1 hypothetical protein P152DRAFT_512810 [Eremomyces bilateralis CBS 781.70]